MPWALASTRRYYLRAAVAESLELQEDMAGDILGRRSALAVSALPANLPYKKKLSEAIDPDLEEEMGLTVYLYEGLEDLLGCDAEELEDWAGIEPDEAAKVLTFLETL